MEKITFWQTEPVEFHLLVPRITNLQELLDALKDEGVEVTQSDLRTSDYIRCRATKKVFCKLFNVKLRWRKFTIGSWELDGEGSLPDGVKECLLNRNILFPPDMIKNWRIVRGTEG